MIGKNAVYVKLGHACTDWSSDISEVESQYLIFDQLPELSLSAKMKGNLADIGRNDLDYNELEDALCYYKLIKILF